MIRRRKEADERGAVLVELAIILPFMLLMVLGMVEAGMAWRDTISVTSAARQGARVTSHLGQDLNADREGLYAVQAVLGDLADDIELVIIYNANGDGTVPSQCMDESRSTGSVHCNRYTTAMLDDLSDDNKWGCQAGSYDRTWCPDDRDDKAETADHIGVYVQFRHGYTTGVFPGDDVLIGRHTVMRIEPELD